jgi:hypothetical protein
LLVYAKLNGYPFWPAKLLKPMGTHLDVRFFGAHDRSVVPTDNCLWLSDEWPERNQPQFNKSLKASFDELGVHIQKLEERFGLFVYARNNVSVDTDNPHVFVKALSCKKKFFFSKFIFEIKCPRILFFLLCKHTFT